MIKFCAWENFFVKRIEKVREQELNQLKAKKYLDAGCVYFWASTPILMSVLTLTACYWRPSVVIRQEIRRLKGLPTLVHLLKSDEYEDEPIVSVTAIALRNLAIDSKNRELIGKYAMKIRIDSETCSNGFAYVAQEVWIQQGTIRENILLVLKWIMTFTKKCLMHVV